VTAAELQEKVSDLARSNAQLAQERETLEQRRTELEQKHAELEQECDAFRKVVALLQEQNEKLKRGLLGQKAERLPKNDAQLSLSILELVLRGSAAAEDDAGQPTADDDEQTIGEHTRRRPRTEAAARGPASRHRRDRPA
jgi:chromosome segregation ATPase